MENDHGELQEEVVAVEEESSSESSVATVNIEDEYWRYLLTHGERPKSVFAFTDHLGIPEGDFYEVATNFDSLEGAYWESLVRETMDVLAADEDYATYSSEDKVLAFYYTFFSHAQKNRSRLVEFFPKFERSCGKLKGMKKAYMEHAKEIIQQGIQDGTIADRKKLSDMYPALMFDQFRGIIEFHRKDNSAEFQDTDAFVEKTVRFGADMVRGGTVESAFDLGRFILRRFTV